MPTVSIERMLRSGLEVLAPQRCAACDLPCRSPLCPACRADLAATAARCRRCAAATVMHGVCGQCFVDPPAFNRAYAGFDYAFPLDAMLTRFKYHADLSLLPALSLMVEALAAVLGSARGLLVPVPLHPDRERERGFNQSLLLARRLADNSDLTLAPNLLVRRVDTPPQAALPATERADNVRDAFAARGDFAGARIWLFDDVMTTGATLDAAAQALTGAGALAVNVIALARARG